jgi:glucoamylase
MAGPYRGTGEGSVSLEVLVFWRTLLGSTAVALTVSTVGVVGSSATPPSGVPAPGGPGAKATWTEANKTGFGTARARRSNVWFTLQRGRTSEVFYPDLSTPSVRSLELVVTGAGFTDRESTDMRHRTIRPDARSLTFKEVNTDKQRKYRIVETFVSDPRRAALDVRIRFDSLDGGAYRVYALYDPSLANSGMDDSGRTAGHALVASDAGGRVSSALVSRPAFDETSTGYLGTSDGWTDLENDQTLDHPYDHAGPGNIVQIGRIADLTGKGRHERARLVLGFGHSVSGARDVARAGVRTAFSTTKQRYQDGWHTWLGSLKPVPASADGVRRQYLASALVVAAAEDKLHRGAFVASPTAPWVWGDEVPDLSSPSGAYHLVWARDAYQFGTALWAMGDKAAARRIVDWLFTVQQKPDGSFPQNSDVTGTPVWGSLQLDEVALPIVLAHLVGRDGPTTYAHVKKAADFIADFVDPVTGRHSPFTPQERWENQSGYSPNSIAAQINGLVCAADMARRNGDDASAKRWLNLADRWRARVEKWTVTTNGPLSRHPYFLRLTKDGDPNAGTTYAIGDGGPISVDQRRVVDPSFLDLVRYGILRPRDPAVRSSLPVIDRQLRVKTPNGTFWHRSSFDGYGETRTGHEWTITDSGTFQTLGRAWPILTDERGEYAVTTGAPAERYLHAMARATGPSDLLAEQVWDGRPPTGRPCCRLGEGTRSATPLIWSHAALIRLAWTIQRGEPVDRQPVVAHRYLR